MCKMVRIFQLPPTFTSLTVDIERTNSDEDEKDKGKFGTNELDAHEIIVKKIE